MNAAKVGQMIPDSRYARFVPTHTHECRDCGGTIECDYPETWCDAGRGWGGGNSNCDCAK
jgi:hypothetical protein